MLATALALSACVSSPTYMPNPDALYPIEMVKCADEPAVPPRPAPDEPRTEAQKGQFLADVREAGADCRDTVSQWYDRRERYVLQWERETHGAGERAWRRLTGKSGDTSR